MITIYCAVNIFSVPGKARFMLPETEKKVANLRSRTKEAKDELEKLIAALAKNTDEYVNGLVKQAGFWLDDVETHFIAMLQEKRSPARTLTEESGIVSAAELHFSTIALSLLNYIRHIVSRHGAGVRSVG
jgi:hypothetical protein